MSRSLWLFLALPAAVLAQQPGIAAGPEAPAGSAVINGVVFDSISSERLAGAMVQLVAADGADAGHVLTATSDSLGRFTLNGVAPGNYVAGFFHPALDTLGLESGTHQVAVRDGSQVLFLSSPSARTIIGSLCGVASANDSTGLLMGHVRSTGSHEPIDGASVRVEWSETVIGRGGVHNRNREGTAQTQGPGWFALCDVPAGFELTARAWYGGDSTGFVATEIPGDGLRHLTLNVGGAVLAPVTHDDSTKAEDPMLGPELLARRGGAELTGMVHDDEGKPVGDARVLVWGTSMGVVTGDRGSFEMDSLPGGTSTLEVRALGFVPVHRIVQLAAGQPARIDVSLGERVTSLPTVTVRANLVYSRGLAQFEQHKRGSIGGFFIGPQEIQSRPISRISSLVQGLPNVEVSYHGGTSIVMHHAGNQVGTMTTCVPTFYVDGVKSFLSADELDWYFHTDEVAGIEVYNRESQLPIEFQDMLNSCGAIAIWTRPPQPKIKK